MSRSMAECEQHGEYMEFGPNYSCPKCPTPTPWSIHFGTKYPHIKGPNGEYVQESGHPPRLEADARLIVHAVNSHERLVSALRRAMDEMNHHQGCAMGRAFGSNVYPPPTCNCWRAEARDVLKDVEEGR